MSAVDFRPCCFSAGHTLLVTVTEACNQRCLHCMRSAVVAAAGPLNIGKLERALDDFLADHGVDRVVISGGEPTLVPNLVDLIQSISDRGLRSTVCSNGLLMPHRAAAYRAAGLTRTTISLDGLHDSYDGWRRSTRGFERALRGLDASIAAGLRVTVNVTLHDQIASEASAMAAVLQGRGLAGVSVTSPMAGGRMAEQAERAEALTEDDVFAFAAELRGLVDVPVSVRIPRCNSSACPAGREVFWMQSDGQISGCPDTGTPNVVDLRSAA